MKADSFTRAEIEERLADFQSYVEDNEKREKTLGVPHVNEEFYHWKNYCLKWANGYRLMLSGLEVDE